jgi:amidohydrolase
MIIGRFKTLVKNMALAMNCTTEISVESITPAVVNNPELTTRVQNVVENILPQATLDTTERTMGSEDMAFMMDEIPGCYFFIGSSNSEKGLDAKHHHPRFDFDESALTTGAALMTAAIADLLS